MDNKLSLWNIHDWLDERGVEHLYTLEDDLPLFTGIRFPAPEVDQESFAVIYDVTDNTQYSSILSFKSGRIYFRFLHAAEAMNLLSEMLYIYSDWLKKLTSANLSHSSLGELLSDAASLFRLPMIAVRNTKIEACTEDEINWNGRDLREALPDLSFIRSCCEALKEAAFSNGILLLKTEDYGKLLMGQIPFRNHYILLFASVGSRKITQADVLLFTQILHAVNIHLRNRRDLTEQYYTSSFHAFSSFAEGSVPSPVSLRHVLKNMGWQRNDIYQVFCIQFRNTVLQDYPSLLYSVLRNCFSCCYTLVREDRIFLFLNVSRAVPVPDETAFSELLPISLLYIGQSNRHGGITNLPYLIRQAEQALFIARQTEKPFVNAQDISTQAVLKQFYSDSSLQAMVHPAIILLSELDNGSKAGFGYLDTLQAYLQSGANISAASRELRLHRNTLVNRIDRIKELTGLSLTDPKELEALLLSLIIYHHQKNTP